MTVTQMTHPIFRLQEINDKIRILLQGIRSSDDDTVPRGQSEEKESMEQCLRIYAEASKNLMDRVQELSIIEGRIEDKDTVMQEHNRADNVKHQRPINAQNSQQVGPVSINVFEDISAALDACQVIVAAPGSSMLATRITAKAGATQWIGQMPDRTLGNDLQDTRRVWFSGK